MLVNNLFLLLWKTLKAQKGLEQEYQVSYGISTLFHLENGRDVTVYFILDRTEICALLSGRSKICERLQKGAVARL